MTDTTMNAARLFAVRDALVDAAKRDLDAATDLASSSRDNRSYVAVAGARRELAFTLDTIARRAAEDEHKATGRRAGA